MALRIGGCAVRAELTQRSFLLQLPYSSRTGQCRNFSAGTTLARGKFDHLDYLKKPRYFKGEDESRRGARSGGKEFREKESRSTNKSGSKGSAYKHSSFGGAARPKDAFDQAGFGRSGRRSRGPSNVDEAFASGGRRAQERKDRLRKSRRKFSGYESFKDDFPSSETDLEVRGTGFEESGELRNRGSSGTTFRPFNNDARGPGAFNGATARGRNNESGKAKGGWRGPATTDESRSWQDQKRKPARVPLKGLPDDTRTETITAKEKEVFNRIFDEMAPKPPSDQFTDPQEDASEDYVAFETKPLKEEDDKGDEDLDKILRDAAAFEKRHGGGSILTPEKAQEAAGDDVYNRKLADLLRYPDALRRLAAKTLIHWTPSAALDQDKSRSTSTKEPTMGKVGRMLSQTKTDFELWDIMEHKVFSIFAPAPRLKLKQSERRDAYFAGGKGAVRKAVVRKAKGAQAQAQASAEDEGEGEGEGEATTDPAHTTVGAHYPRLLVLAFRKLRDDFQLPDSALALFYRFKSLGPKSMALGATTTLYNEVMALKWSAYSDFQGIAALLEDMDRGGLEFDPHTLATLQDVLDETRRVVAGEMGGVAQEMWKMERFRLGLRQLGEWRSTVGARLVEKMVREKESGGVVEL